MYLVYAIVAILVGITVAYNVYISFANQTADMPGAWGSTVTLIGIIVPAAFTLLILGLLTLGGGGKR
jgi:hypothetical protein